MTADGLTGLQDRRTFQAAVERELSRCRRDGGVFSIVLIDIDHFARINETRGHLAGDAVLRQLGLLVRGHTRRDDIASRIGGEELAVLLPAIDRVAALTFAEKLRVAVESTTFAYDETPFPVTISLGVSTFMPADTDPLAFIARADERLYDAKRNGRNAVRG